MVRGRITTPALFPVLESDQVMKEVSDGGEYVHLVPRPHSEMTESITERLM